MFETPEHARAALAAHFKPELVEPLMRALVPTIVLTPRDDGAPAVLGGSRLGGTPDLPLGLDWPRPVPPTDPEDIARRGNDEARAMMREHLAAELPYAFIGQIDLAEAAALGTFAEPLPDVGRLLFFYDAIVGPWETGTRVARVIWDRSPLDRLAPRAMPPDLAAAAERSRAGLVEAGFSPKPGDVDGYGAAPRVVMLTPTYRLASAFALECQPVPEIYGFPNPPDFGVRSAYIDLLTDRDPMYPDTWRRHQLLGSPIPEGSDDPRCEAIESLDDIRTMSTSKQRNVYYASVLARAHACMLLLQVDLSAWGDLQGTLYFVMPSTDCVERRFDGVVAVYQQT